MLPLLLFLTDTKVWNCHATHRVLIQYFSIHHGIEVVGLVSSSVSLAAKMIAWNRLISKMVLI